MSQRNSDQRQRRPPNSIPQGVPRDWRTFQAQLAANPAVDQDSPFLPTHYPHLDMPLEGEARSIASFNNASAVRPLTLNTDLPPNPNPPAPYTPVSSFARALEQTRYPRRRSSLQAPIGVQPTTSTSRNAPAPVPPMPPNRNFLQPPDMDSSLSAEDRLFEDLQRILYTPPPHPPHALAGTDDLQGRFHQERRELLDRAFGRSSNADGLAPYAGIDPRIPSRLAGLQQRAREREITLERIRSRTQAMTAPTPMPRARVEHFTPLPALKSSECPICFEDYDDYEHCAIRLHNVGCDHIFGRSCIQEWVNSPMRNAHRCPSCRRSIGGALVDAETGSSLPSQQERDLPADVRQQVEDIQARLAARTQPMARNLVETTRATSGGHTNPREAARSQRREARARSYQARGNMAAAALLRDQDSSSRALSGPYSPAHAATQPRLTNSPPYRSHAPAISPRERAARIQRNIAELTSQRGLRSSANVALARSDSGRLSSQHIQAMIEQREEEMRDLDRQIEAARITRDVLMRHEGEVVREEEMANFMRR